MTYRNITAEEISKLINCPFVGHNVEINGLNLCNRQTEYKSILSYIAAEKYIDAVNENEAVSALFIPITIKEDVLASLSRELTLFVVDYPEEQFYKLHEILFSRVFYTESENPPKVGNHCSIHSSAVIENNVIIGDNVIVGPNSVIRKNSIIEDNVRIGCCSVIGSEGFQGIRFSDSTVHAIPHVGGTKICRNVFVGDNTTIGNALFEGHTVIGEGTIIDNHVHVAHNLTIGKNNAITACSLLMGSAVVKDNCWLAPNAVVMNKKIISDNSMVGSMSLVTKDVPEGETVVGIPAKLWKKS